MLRSGVKFAVAAAIAGWMLAACAGGAGTSSLPAAQQPQSIMFSGSHTLIEDGRPVAGTHVMFQHHVIGSVPAPGTASDNLIYHNGEVMTFPAIGLVYWGFGTTGDPDNEIPRLNEFLKHMRASVPLNVVTQYYEIVNGHKYYVPNYPAMSIAIWDDDTDPLPGSSVRDKDIQSEALRAKTHFNFVLPGVDNLIIVATPHGLKMNYAACAYHGKIQGVLTYTNLPYQPDFGAGCGAYSVNSGPAGVLDGVTETAIHEIAESMTDPFYAGWLDAQGSEIGDKCQQYAANQVFDGKQYPVQPLWSNAQTGCAY